MAEEFEVSGHLEHLIGKKKNKFTIWIREAGKKVEEVQNVKILFKDDVGYTVEAVKYLGKNRKFFVPHTSIVRMRSELH